MQVQVNCGDGLQAKETLERWADEFLNDALARFRGELTRVEVQLSDGAHGKHGGQDMRCTLEARLAAHQPVAVTHFAETMDDAVRGAAQKLAHALEHTFGKLDRHRHRDRETIRRDPDVVEQGNS
ncbi:MAG TPA: HPF/RaiA family ribosome-associated protein [Ramlibacter sp.]